MRSAVKLLLVITVLAATPLMAESAGSVRGKVVGPDSRPMAGVLVELRNALTGFKAQSATTTDGSFSFNNVPFNPYELRADVQGFAPLRQAVDVHSAVPSAVTLQLRIQEVTESISVTAEQPAAQLETDNTQSHVDIDKSYIAKAPAAVASRAMEQIVTSTPGFAKDENGRFHFQGSHSQSEYVVDGQTIADQTGVTFSNSIDPGLAQGIEIIYGNVPAEFGEKVGAVINLTTKSGIGLGAPKTEAYAGGSRFSTVEGAASVGAGSQTFGYYASVNGSKSNRFTDPVNFNNLHNIGNTYRGFLRLDGSTPDSKNSIRFTVLAGRTHRDVPNTYTQEAAGQDERVHTSDENLNLGWQSILSKTSLLEVVAFGRFSKFRLNPSPNDTPVIAYSDRTLNNYGIAPSFSWTNANNEVKVGVNLKRYPIREHFSFGITDPTLNDPAMSGYNPNLGPYDLTRGGTYFLFDGKRTGNYDAAYAQDNFRLKNLTVNAGLRYDHNTLPLTESMVQPRVGAAYYVEATRTVFRASYDRVAYTPEYENILFSSSTAAQSLVPPDVQQSNQLGGGVLLIHSERQNAINVGMQQAVGGHVRLDADYWRRHSQFSGDQDQFQNTGIVFPMAFKSGHYEGWDVRADLAPYAGLHGFISAGHVHAVYVPPLAGGLFLDSSKLDTLTAGPFLIDHDQKLQAQMGLIYDLGRSGIWAGTNIRYDSGLVCGSGPSDLAGDPDNSFAIPFIAVHSGTGLDPNRIKPRTIVDVSLGADLQQYHLPLSVQIDVLNATNKQGVYNILSTFGGTHVTPPRTVAARLRYSY